MRCWLRGWKCAVLVLVLAACALFAAYLLLMKPMWFVGIRTTLNGQGQPEPYQYGGCPKVSAGGWETASASGWYWLQINYQTHQLRWFNSSTADSWVFTDDLANNEPLRISADGQVMLLLRHHRSSIPLTEKLHEAIDSHCPDFPVGYRGELCAVRRPFTVIAQLPVTVYPDPSSLNLTWCGASVHDMVLLRDDHSLAIDIGGPAKRRWCIFRW